MTRLYIQPSWIDSCSDHGEWSGGNDQYRGDKSIEAVPTYINGRPNVRAFSDEAIEARKEKRKTSIPLKQRILPQAARLDKLQAEIVELENAYRNGEFSPQEYTLLREVAFAKKARAETLYKKAISVKAPSYADEDDELSFNTQEDGEESAYDSCAVDYSKAAPSPASSQAPDTHYSANNIPAWITELPSENSFKSFLIFSCKATRKVVELSQQVRKASKAANQYYQTLKDL